jgi:hypothetical protein
MPWKTPEIPGPGRATMRRKSTELAVPHQQTVAAAGDYLLATTGGLLYNNDVVGEGIVAVGVRGAQRYLGAVERCTEAVDTSPNVSSGVARESVAPFLGITQQSLLAGTIESQASMLAELRARNGEVRR